MVFLNGIHGLPCFGGDTEDGGLERMERLLGDVTKQVVARAIAISRARTLVDAEMMIGEGAAGTAPLRQKDRGVATPASEASGELSPPKRPALRNIKREPTHDPSALPPRRVGSRLVFTVIEGGGARREEGFNVRRLRRNASEERQRELGIRLVSG